VDRTAGKKKTGSHTDVAEMPGYPTKKLLFGGPDTLTNAAEVIVEGATVSGLQPSWAQVGRG